MSSDNNLQEMEAGTTQSKTAVNAGAKPADPMPTMADPGTQLGSVEDLGGPTPQNYKPDDDSAKLKEPSLKTVSNVVNAKAGKADPMPKGMKEEEEVEAEEVVAEAEDLVEQLVLVDGGYQEHVGAPWVQCHGKRLRRHLRHHLLGLIARGVPPFDT